MGYKETLFNQLPEYLYNSALFQQVFDIEGQELDLLKINVDDLLFQISPYTATWGLTAWENMLGIPTNTKEDLEVRRNRCTAKLAYIAPLTPPALESILSHFADGVQVQNSTTEDYKFNVFFKTGDTFDVAMQDVINTLEEVKPAHLDYNLGFAYITKMKGAVNAKVYIHDCKMCGTIKCGKGVL